jgi:hypothetical protein
MESAECEESTRNRWGSVKPSNRAPIFQVDLNLDELTTNISDTKIQQDICNNELGPGQPAQVFSGQWVDKKGKKRDGRVILSRER